jgi:predicted transcriptional regulator
MTKTSIRLLEIVEQLTEDERKQLLWKAIQMLEPVEPEPDEVEAIERGRNDFARGETVRHEDIDWN